MIGGKYFAVANQAKMYRERMPMIDSIGICWQWRLMFMITFSDLDFHLVIMF